MKRLLLPLLLTAACNQAEDRPLPVAQPGQPGQPGVYRAEATEPEVRAVAYACSALQAECGPHIETACCSGLFCSTDILAYGPGTCIAPQADGAFCAEDAHCAGGHCIANVCRSAECGDAGTACADTFPCCDGLVCDLVGYTEGVCVPPFEDGRFCVDDAQCESGHCVDNVCGTPTCRDAGTECYDDFQACCSGLFCLQAPGTYGLAYCSAPLPAGEYCLDPAQCESGACTDNVCE